MSPETINQMGLHPGHFVSGQTGHHLLACANCQTPLVPKPGVSAITCLNCGQQHNFLDPPANAETGNHQLGDTVAVKWGERWWSAHIVEVVQPGQLWKVHFEGWGPIFDDVAESARIRVLDYVPGDSIVPPPFESEALEVKRRSRLLPVILFAVLLAGIAVTIHLAVNSQIASTTKVNSFPVRAGVITGPVSSQLVTASTPVQYGQKFHVEWGGNWYPGKAIHVSSAGEITIRYDDWGREYDEVVDRTRLRLVNQ